MRIIFNRLISVIPNIFGVIIVTFIIVRILPGDPAIFFAGPLASAEAIEKIKIEMNLDKNLFQQLIIYITELFQGDLGNSLTTGQPVLIDLIKRLPASLELTLCSLIFSFIISIPVGIYSAIKKDTLFDHIVRATVTIVAALPTFFVALLLVFTLYYVFPIASAPFGRLNLFADPPDFFTGFYLIDSLIIGDFNLWYASFSHLILPSISLGLFAVAPLTRMIRASMIEILSNDFIIAAKSYGLSTYKVIIIYAFKNVLISLLNTFGMIFSFLLGASVLVEKVYSWPGIGTYAVKAVLTSDYASVQGFVLVIAILYVILNLFIDVISKLFDPRISYTN